MKSGLDVFRTSTSRYSSLSSFDAEQLRSIVLNVYLPDASVTPMDASTSKTPLEYAPSVDELMPVPFWSSHVAALIYYEI